MHLPVTYENREIAIPIKIPMTYFTDTEQRLQKFIWSHKWPRIAAAILGKNNKIRGIKLDISRTWYKTVLQGHRNFVWYWHKNRHIDQWNRIESPEIYPSLYGQLKSHKEGRSIKWNKNSLFNKWCWEIWTATCKTMKLDLQLTPHTKINSRWIKDLNVSHDTIKVLEDKIGRKISDIPCSNIFTNMSPRARDIKERIKNGTSSK